MKKQIPRLCEITIIIKKVNHKLENTHLQFCYMAYNVFLYSVVINRFLIEESEPVETVQHIYYSKSLFAH